MRLARRAYRVLADKQQPVKISPPVWRTVSEGVLQELQFLLPVSERGNSWADRIIKGEYETTLLTALTKFVKKDGVFYDIGAHIGFYTCAWLHLGGSYTVAFEPTPYNQDIFLRTMEKNKYPEKTRLLPYALGDFDGQSNLLVNQSSSGSSSMAYVENIGGIRDQVNSLQYRFSKKMPIAVKCLDNIIDDDKIPPPDVIKLDVEGAEYHVLRGARKILEKFRPVIFCEIHNIDAALMIGQYLSHLRYDIEILNNNNLQPICLCIPL